MDEPQLTVEHARRLSMMTLALLGRDGAPMLHIDADDKPRTGKPARVGGLAIVEFPADKSQGLFRRIDVYLAAEDEGPFKLDPRRRLFSLKTAHYAAPPDWEFEIRIDPGLWYNVTSALFVATLGPDAFVH
jgi:hypothetical protein